jgi:hypothetical protein
MQRRMTQAQQISQATKQANSHHTIAIYASPEAQLRSERDIAIKLCMMFFKDDDGFPFHLSDGQADIFNVIMLKRYNRNQVETTTQYGKSETISMAVVLRSITYHEKWTILAGDQNKSDIIMGKAIQHIFDHPTLVEQIELEGLPKLEKLKHQKSHDRITWRDGGEIRTLTADARNRKRVKESLTGQGARNIIEDEAALIPDDLQAMVMRMLGGHKDSFLLKIGNPFYRNHFYRSSKNKKYHHIHIDYHQAIAEGRLTQDFIEEMRAEPFFDVLYEVKFPPDDDVVTGGYRRLFSDTLIADSLITEEEYQAMLADDEQAITLDNETRVLKGERRLGNDFAGGGSDRTTFTLRTPTVLKLLEVNAGDDTMQHVVTVQKYRDQYEVAAGNIGNDYGGLGQGISDRLYELDIYVNKVMFGGGASDRSKYKNKRAEMYFLFKQWLEAGGKIVDSPEWQELAVVYYKSDSSSRFQIEPKEDLKKRLRELGLTVTSPDVADAGALTFADNSEMIDDDDFEVV